MKGSQVLLICAAAIVVAANLQSYDASPDLCHWPDLLGLEASSLCYHDTPTRTREEVAEVREVVAASDVQEQAASLWPVATSCVTTSSNGSKVFCVYSNPEFAGGRGITILTSPSEALEIAKSTAFTNPNLYKTVKDFNAPTSPRWRVEEVPGKGMGLIAAQNLQIGDHIMSVSASIMIDYNLFDYVPEDTLLEMQVKGVSYLPHKAILLNLSTHDEVDNYAAQVSKVILTNAFDISDIEVLERPEGQKGENFYTVFPEVSRMNHDCRPNSHYYFDPDTFTQNVFAVRPILAGEEITISYVDPFIPRQERLERLDHSWHFPCSCSLCTQHERLGADSDARIAQILELREKLSDWSPSSEATPEMAELLLSLYQQERIDSRIYEPYTYAAVAYNGVGEATTAAKYANLAIQHGFIANGPKDDDWLDMRWLIDNPQKHWSWMMRAKKQTN